MFILVVIGLVVVSVLMALWSLWRISKIDEMEGVRKELSRNRVVFHRDSSDST